MTQESSLHSENPHFIPRPRFQWAEFPIRIIRKARAVFIPFDENMWLESTHEPVEIATPDDFRDQIDTTLQYTILKELLATLTEREQKVIYLRFWEGLTFKECEEHLQITHGRIQQIEAKALRKLRHPNRSKLLQPYRENRIPAGDLPERTFPQRTGRTPQAHTDVEMSVEPIHIADNEEEPPQIPVEECKISPDAPKPKSALSPKPYPWTPKELAEIHQKEQERIDRHNADMIAIASRYTNKGFGFWEDKDKKSAFD